MLTGKTDTFVKRLSGGDHGSTGDDALDMSLKNAPIDGGTEAEVVGIDQKLFHLGQGFEKLGS